MQYHDGLIEINFVKRGDRTVADRIYREGNSRVSAPIRDTGNTPVYFLISTGGGFIEGESYFQSVTLGSNTHAVLTTQTPNYVYKCINNNLTKQETILNVNAGALLECYLDEVVPYKDTRYFQEMTINLEEKSSLILTDGLTSGWSQDGQPFQYCSVRLKTRIFKDGKLLLNDYLICNPAEDSMSELGFFEGYTNFNSIVIIDDQITEFTIKQLRKQLDSIETSCRYGLTQVTNGLVLRVLGNNYHGNRQLLTLVINYYRKCIKELESIHLRKTDFHLK